MISDSNQTFPCIFYEEKVKHGDYSMVKIEAKIEDGSHGKRTLPRFSGDKGEEGLF